MNQVPLPGMSWGGKLWRFARLIIAAEILAAAAFTGYMLWGQNLGAAGVYEAPPLDQVSLYAPQKAVVHIKDGGGWFKREHGYRLTNLENLSAAVGEISLEAAVVLHGDGVLLLADAKSDERLAARVDALRKNGVRFIVCRQSMIGKRLRLEDLHGVSQNDLVAFATPEILRLQQRGFAYIRL